MEDSGFRTLVRNFVVEILIYGALVVGYFLLVLRLLGGPLDLLFQRNLMLYGIVGLVLIAAQGMLLDAVTSYILRWLRLDKLE
jgi:hypothetical protein